jgi:hypothetical protein
MKLFLLFRTDKVDYDQYNSAVVAAGNKYQASRIPPGNHGWVKDISTIKVEYLGEAKAGTKRGVICASYNAG